MSNNRYISLRVNNEQVELGEETAFSLSFTINDPDDWQSVNSDGASVSLPATKKNDAIFNTYHNPDVIDLTPGQQKRNLMDFILNVNGTNPVMRGKLLLNSAVSKEKPERYETSVAGGNGDWIIDMQNLTLWDCLNTSPHTFDVATIEQSWRRRSIGGYDSDEFHDFVYAPVRYRQPFQYANPVANARGAAGVQIYNAINIYMLRPMISKYWIIIRAFRQLGYTVQSQFLETKYYRNQALEWTFGDFFDINSQIVMGVAFKAAGQIYPTPGAMPSSTELYTGLDTNALHSKWDVASGSGYVHNYIDGSGNYKNFWLNNTNVPNGFDNFGLYSFDATTGTATWNFNPPPQFLPYLGSNVTINFLLNLICLAPKTNTADYLLWVEVTQIPLSGPTTVTDILIDVLSTIGTSFVTKGNLLSPTPFNFSYSGVNVGDTLKFRIKYQLGTSGCDIISAGWLNTNPIPPGANSWQFDSITEQWANIVSPAQNQPIYSTFEMTGIQVQLGTPVNFQYYDSFRSYNFLDFLGGEVEAYDLVISTDPLNKVVTIEPFANAIIPDYDETGIYIGDITLTGYYNRTAILDWTAKIDQNKECTIENFNNCTRQLDYSMKQDGSDGGQNIWSARNLGIYLNNTVRPRINNTEIDNGIIAGVPGASRYMLPNRFAKGNTQKTNRFFSSTLHYRETNFKALGGPTWPSPQFITIFPENINDSSASAVTQVFQPKTAFYKGLMDPAAFGGWRWVGDPSSPYTDGGSPSATGFPLPYAFAVNYNNLPGLLIAGGDKDPILTYCDQMVYDSTGAPVVAPGLMRLFQLPRLATMRNGQLMHIFLRLNLNDISNFGHRNCIKIKNSLYALLAINEWNPEADDSCEVVLWKIANVEQTDIDNSYPSNNSITNDPAVLPQYDLRYSQMLLFPTDIPTV